MSDKSRCRFWLVMSILSVVCVASRIWDLVEAKKNWGDVVSDLVVCFLCFYFYFQNRKKLGADNNTKSDDTNK